MFRNAHTYSSFRCGGAYKREPAQIVVLGQQVSPTRDIYLRRRLAESALPVVYWTLGEECPVSLDGAFLIVVRYVDSTSMAAIEGARSKLSGVAWLVDDDIAAAVGDGTLPLHYRIVMAHFWLRFARRLARVTSEIWAASDALADRLSRSGTVLRIDPLPEPFALPRERGVSNGGERRIFYHGQKTHRTERRWLYRIVKAIHDRYPQTHFEIVGDGAVRKLYAGLERVTVLQALDWPDYVERSRTVRFDIGLAPLVATPFNRARSWVKYLDIARFGAVGIYADGPPYDLVVRNGENGLLCAADDPEAWIEALAALVVKDDLLKRLAEGVDWPSPVETPPTLRALMKEDS